MQSKTDLLHHEKRNSLRRSVSDPIVHWINSVVVSFLTTLCGLFATTPESIKKQKPRERGNSPPPTGGVSSF